MERYFIRSTKYALRPRETKNGTVYDVVFRIITMAGDTKQKVLCGYSTKTAAKKAYTDFVAQYCDPVPANFEPKKKAITVREAYAKYIATKAATLKDSSIVSIDNIFRRHVLPLIGDKAIDSFKRSDAIMFIDQLCVRKQDDGRPYSRKYLATIRGHVNSLFEWLSVRYDTANPFKTVTLPKVASKKTKQQKLLFWEREQFETFLAVIDNPMYYAFFATLFYCGCRKSEAFALTPADYNGKELRINKTVTRKTTDGSLYKVTATKNERDYSIPLCGPIKRILDNYTATATAEGPFLFGGSKPLAPTTVQRIFDYYRQASGVPKIKIHGLRHSFVSMLIHHGANYMVVAELIGDTPEQVLNTYGHMWESDKRKVIANIE